MNEEKAERAKPDGPGRGWHGDTEGHRRAGQKGGQAVSQDREHMAQIGRRGGQTLGQNREYMAEIGRLGAIRKRENRIRRTTDERRTSDVRHE